MCERFRAHKVINKAQYQPTEQGPVGNLFCISLGFVEKVMTWVTWHACVTLTVLCDNFLSFFSKNKTKGLKTKDLFHNIFYSSNIVTLGVTLETCEVITWTSEA